jgi:hypothetical protein
MNLDALWMVYCVASQPDGSGGGGGVGVGAAGNLHTAVLVTAVPDSDHLHCQCISGAKCTAFHPLR